MDQICEKIQMLRNQQNLTLKELSVKTGLSVSFLSQVERGTSSLAITSLKKIADAFNVPITTFFESYQNHTFVVKAQEQQPFKIEGCRSEYVRLAGDFTEKKLEPMLVILPPGKQYDTVFNHPGEEFNYVLEGAVIFNIDGKEYLIQKGDSIHYPSSLPHFWVNPLEHNSKIISVLTPLIF
ncbi:helix-turn-helix domain-containing protein [Desulforamulus ruminis]|uniref:Cupin 2 conserved barrel domain protein n=1 Tax=Desulforamulus ruminis (strain ATCC 23193 / DSM 2154 / NCIMB 8452 / DL) TaxID=696281 RepID=F6DK65_DESRL|nr:XRE family transcriptional regulator [Desulforamulus ruminis]AEG60379.1 Cupin 2 conserved barrel domain protein [Desulforamulus ruminis DSM 2154]